MCEIWKVQWQDTPTANLIRKNRGSTAIREIYMPRKYLNQALAWASFFSMDISMHVCVFVCPPPGYKNHSHEMKPE